MWGPIGTCHISATVTLSLVPLCLTACALAPLCLTACGMRRCPASRVGQGTSSAHVQRMGIQGATAPQGAARCCKSPCCGPRRGGRRPLPHQDGDTSLRLPHTQQVQAANGWIESNRLKSAQQGSVATHTLQGAIRGTDARKRAASALAAASTALEERPPSQ